jgi:hypothetical protein
MMPTTSSCPGDPNGLLGKPLMEDYLLALRIFNR